MTRQEVPPLLTLSGALLETQWDRVGHITLSDRCRRPVGRGKKKKPRCLIFGTRTTSPYILVIGRAHVYRSIPIHGELHTHSPEVFFNDALGHGPPRAQACGRPSPEDLWLSLKRVVRVFPEDGEVHALHAL